MSTTKTPRRRARAIAGGATVAWLVLAITSPASDPDPLAFDPAAFRAQSLALGEAVVSYRAYEGIVYVAKALDTNHQVLNVYVPAAYGEGRGLGGYDAHSAPIFFPITVGGYLPARPGRPTLGGNGEPNALALALAHGFVVAAPGARGRTLQDGAGRYTGKAPACIVDLKAAVRYLRLNDAVMPGDARRIIANGTSAGGALSALLGATGNSPDFEPYLKDLGAAEQADAIFAASCYCPITDLEHADAAYEWLFHGVNDYAGMRGRGSLSADQVRVSGQLRALFPAYLNSLGLKREDGASLVLQADGEGTFKEYVKSFVVASAQAALKSGKDLAVFDCLRIQGGVVQDVELARFAAQATRMKTPPAFDSLDLRSPENSLFGTATVDAQHFTAYAAANRPGQPVAESLPVKLMNPLRYLGDREATVAGHWRIRHGAVDRDTSLAVPVMLATRLRNAGADVDFALPWGQGHGGDYDLEELFAWMARACPPGEGH